MRSKWKIVYRLDNSHLPTVSTNKSHLTTTNTIIKNESANTKALINKHGVVGKGRGEGPTASHPTSALSSKVIAPAINKSNVGSIEMKTVKSFRRGDVIITADVGKTVKVSDGKADRQIKILPGHVNKRFGSLVLTKKTPKYKSKSK